MAMTHEGQLLETLADFIKHTAAKFFGRGTTLAADAMQEGRIAAVLASRSWRSNSLLTLENHCKKIVRWRIANFAFAQKRSRHASLTNAEGETHDPVDEAAENAERSLMLKEALVRLSTKEKAALDMAIRCEGLRGKPSPRGREVAAKVLGALL